MAISREEVAESGLATIDRFFSGVFSILEAWAPTVQNDISEHLKSGPFSGAQLANIVEAESVKILEQTELPIYGAGFCASEAVVDQGNPLAWWQGPEKEPLASSTFGVGPGAVDLRRLEWYRVPEETGKPNIAGPFVDYLCSNEVTITSSVPIFIDGAFAGVLCLDVLVSELEKTLIPLLSNHERVTVANVNRRVVVSTDSSYDTGDKLPRKECSKENSLAAVSKKYPFMVVAHG